MNARLLGWIAWGMVWGWSLRGEAPLPRLLLRNGDHLTGELRPSGAREFRIRPYWSEEALVLPVDQVRRLTGPPALAERTFGEAGVTLSSGSTLVLTEVRTEGEVLTGSTRWGEQVSLPRGMVREVRFRSGRADERLGWSAGNPGQSEELSDGAVVLYPAVRSVLCAVEHSPETMYLELDLEPAQDSEVNYRLVLDLGKTGRLTVQVDPWRVTVNAVTPDDQGAMRGNRVQVQERRDWTRHRLSMLGNRQTGVFRLRVGDLDPLEWKMAPLGMAKSGSGDAGPLRMQLMLSGDPEQELRLRSSRMDPWTGAEFPPEAPDAGEGLFVVRLDGSTARGEWIALTDAELQLRDPETGEDLRIPREALWRLTGLDVPVPGRDRTGLRLRTGVWGDRWVLDAFTIGDGGMRVEPAGTGGEVFIPFDEISQLDLPHVGTGGGE